MICDGRWADASKGNIQSRLETYNSIGNGTNQRFIFSLSKTALHIFEWSYSF